MAWHAAVQQLRGVRPFGTLHRPARDLGGQTGQQVCTGILTRRRMAVRRHGRREAGPRAGVAGGPGLLHPVEDRVAVAVEPDLTDGLLVAGGLALAPERGAGPAVVVRPPRGGGPLERFPVRVRQHQHVAGSALLGHHGHQSVGPEPDLRQPVGLRHREKVPEPPSDCQKPLWFLILLGISPPRPPPRSFPT